MHADPATVRYTDAALVEICPEETLASQVRVRITGAYSAIEQSTAIVSYCIYVPSLRNADDMNFGES